MIDEKEITEEWARNAEAGPELDRVCAEWMGYFEDDSGSLITPDGDGTVVGPPKSYSKDWSAAGPLLEAMEAKHGGIHPPSCEIECRSYERSEWYTKEEWRQRKWKCLVLIPEHEDRQLFGGAPTPQLAIARACAVLVARGIKKGDLS